LAIFENNSNLSFNVWIFGLQWVLVNTVGYFLINYLFLQLLPQSGLPLFSGNQIMWSVGFFLSLLLSAGVSGLILGGGQWYLLQRHFIWPVSWIWISMLASFVADITANLLPYPTADTAIFIVPIGALIISVLFGTVQCFVLRNQVYYASWWIVANGLGRFLGSVIFMVLVLSDIVQTFPSNYLNTVVEIMNRMLQEVILVTCLIWLLKITVRKDAEEESLLSATEPNNQNAGELASKVL